MDFKSLVPWRERSQTPATREDFSDPIVTFRREMDRMFDDFFNNFGFGGRSPRPLTGGWQGVTPTVDVAETDRELVVTAELPGLDQQDFEVTLAGDVLTIKGEKKAEQERKDGDHYYMERRFGSFSRTIGLPQGIEESAINADYKDGVLHVTIKRRESAQPRRIDVK